MSRTIAFLILAALPISAAIFPEQIGTYKRSAPKTIGLPDKELFDEYGLEETDSAEYAVMDPAAADKKGSKKAAPLKHFTASAWRLHDSTGALALLQYRRPSGATRADVGDLGVRTSDGVIYMYGNYVFQFTGQLPEQNELNMLYTQLPRLSRSPLPALIGYVPAAGMIPNSERYILGPVALSRFAPAIPPSTAAFRLGAEAQMAQYETPKGPMHLTLFNYPTPNMAREQAVEFQKIPGAAVKRTGPLVAVVLSSPDPDQTERVLGKINYQASLTLNEGPPQNVVRGAANMLLAIVTLAGIILVLCLVGGLGFGGYRIFARKYFRKGDPNAMIVLDLDK